MHRRASLLWTGLLAAGGCARCSQPPTWTDVPITSERTIDARPDIDAALDTPDDGDDGAEVALSECGLGCCRGTPSATEVAIDGGDGCGDGCSLVPGATAAFSGSWVFGERPGEVEYGGSLKFRRVDLATGRTVEAWPWPQATYCSTGGAQGILTTAFVATESTAFVCAEGPAFVLHSVDRRTGRDCVLLRHEFGNASHPLPPVDLFRVNGAWVWRHADEYSNHQVHVFPDGAADARPLIIPGGDVTSLTGAGDTLVLVHRGTSSQALAISRAPFTEAHIVWSPGGNIGPLFADPENPNHVVFDHSTSGDELCAAGADIYFFDVSTADTVPPRALTTNSITEFNPVIRGDRIAYLDFLSDVQNPGGCVEDPHSSESIVVTSLRTGGRTYVREGSGLIWLGRDRLWMPWLRNTAFQMLPPE